MPKSDYKNFKEIKKLSFKFSLVILITLSIFLATTQFQTNTLRGHSPIATPEEIFSMYNSTITPTIDGKIEFNATIPTEEWASSAIYDMYGALSLPKGKVLLQNDDDYLYIGLDMIEHEIIDPITAWGAIVYFDVNHNGILDIPDRSIRILNELDETQHIDYLYPVSGVWIVDETGSWGSLLATSNVTINSQFDISYFDTINNHRQYEFRIALDTLNLNPGDIFGIGFEATNKFVTSSGSITWPYCSDINLKFRTYPQFWGDIQLGEDGIFTKYVIKENFNIKDDAIGPNNGTFLAKGDIDGDGYQELIVSSNRTVTGDTNLIIIYDVESGDIVEKWRSWDSIHYSSLYRVQDIECYDFTGDGKDEIYIASSDDHRILALRDWNPATREFDELYLAWENEYLSTPYNLMGYIAIGDATNDGDADILFGDSDASFGILEYDKEFKPFSLWNNAWYGPPDIDGSEVTKVHAVEVAEADHDIYDVNEILILSQFTVDDSLANTGLQIFEAYATSIYDNPTDDPTFGWEDDLSIYSHSNTFDRFGHTIIVDDVDNDDFNEIILVGRDYLKIFGHLTFNDTQIPLVFDINDESSPSMGGGAAVFDLDGDSNNELIFGCNNGTTFVIEIEDLNADNDIEDLIYTIEWKGDIGSSPGKRNSIIGLDVDADGIKDAIIGDNFGQILVLGLGPNPIITITSPSWAYGSSKSSILVEWDIDNLSLPIIYFDIYLNSNFVARIGGGQLGYIVSLVAGDNFVEVECHDISDNVDSDIAYIIHDPGKPEVTIDEPDNYYRTNVQTVQIEYTGFDPLGDDLDYYIYVNGSGTGPITQEYYDVYLPSEGLWNITVLAVDSGGDSGRDMIYVIYDNSGPEIDITTPLDGSAVSTSLIEVRWDAYDELSPIDYFEILRDGELLGNTTDFYYYVGMTIDREYEIKIIAYDILGNQRDSIIHILRDKIDPIIDLVPLTYPTLPNGDYYTDEASVFIEWTSSDTPGSGLDIFEIKINGDLVQTIDPAITFNHTIVLSTEGPNEITVIAWDEAGNFNYDYYTIAFDSQDPFIAITDPYDGYTTSANSVTIIWDAFDIGTAIKEIEIIVDGISEAILTDTSITSYFLDISVTKIYSVTVQVTDYLDRISSDTINVEHNPFAPTLFITSPIESYSYANSEIFYIEWDAYYITATQFVIIVNDTQYNIYTSSTFIASINLTEALGYIDESSYPVANITVIAMESGFNYTDTIFVTLDFLNPLLSIYTPFPYFTILETSFTLGWTGSDSGSGIDCYCLWINNTFINSWGASTSSQNIDVSTFDDGIYNITLVAYDNAGNVKIKTIFLYIYPAPPEFSINMAESIITNDPNFEMEIFVYDPRIGVQEIYVLADNSLEIAHFDYGVNYRDYSFTEAVSILEEDFIGTNDDHNLTISVYDIEGRVRVSHIFITIDKIDPSIFGNPIIDDKLLGSNGNSITIYENESNIHNFTISSRDVYGVGGIQLNIYNVNQSFSYTMTLNTEQSIGELYVYDATINFEDYTAGIYTIQFVITDIAGNSLSQTYLLSVTMEVVETPPDEPPEENPEETVTPNWFMDNLFTIIIPAGSGLLLIIILSIVVSAVVKKRSPNRGWEDVIDAVAYVTKTGLTTCYVPYSLDMFEDEQLFGGAMTGVVGILGEITGETNVEMKVHVMEFGGKRLMICPGLFGNSILLVTDAKPILKELLQKFTLEFELTYKHNLSSELVNLNDFDAVTILVETYFGVRKNLPTFEQVEIIQERFEDINQTETEEYLENNENESTTVADHEIIESSENIMNENSDLTENIENIENNDNTDFNDF
ncbi:MAG TPA: Ig-like domain-containing protein [candidate division Zixibacteria bacterium]|nr:Ig-like domain-containing protein [candidate division Zixibacteria bacterium]